MKSAVKTVVLFALLGAVLAHAQLPTFQHIILVIQENRTPDNLFGGNPTFEPGVDLQLAAGAQPWCLGACFNPSHQNESWRLQHKSGFCASSVTSGSCATATCNGVKGTAVPSCPQESYVSTTYDSGVVLPYFDIAQKYGFANYLFQTNQGPSQPAHDFLFGGTSAPTGDPTQQYFNYFAADNPGNNGPNTGCEALAAQKIPLVTPDGTFGDATFPSAKLYPCFDHGTLSDLIEGAGKSWRYYTNDFGDIWTAPNGISHICIAPGGQEGQPCANQDFTQNVTVSPKQILLDLGAGGGQCNNLASMSWVIPNGTWSDHPGLSGNNKSSSSIEGGPNWVANIINALGTSTCTDTIKGKAVPYWQDTAIFVVWDDWGGFYDHVPPFKVSVGTKGSCTTWGCGYTYGYRVPMLVVSAYTPAGYVSGDTRTHGETFPYIHDFGSILAFVENNFGIGIGSINPAKNNYPFADAFAPDYTAQPLNVPLADFFSLTSARTFQQVETTDTSFDTSYFLDYKGPAIDPDNDATEP
jgi:phospholipase C